jgi:CBS domain-containing protein
VGGEDAEQDVLEEPAVGDYRLPHGVEELLDGLTVRDLATSEASVDADDSAAGLLDRLLRERRTDLLVRDGDDVVGVVTAGSLRSIDPAEFAGTRVGDIASTDLPRLDVDQGAFEGLLALNQSGGDVALVESDGRLVGAISQADFAAALSLRRGARPA